MSFFNDRTRQVTDHERATSKASKTGRPAVSEELRAAAPRERIAEAMRIAPAAFLVIAFFLLPDAAESLAPHEFTTLATFSGLAIEIGLVVGAVFFVARPPRIVALVWFGALEAILILSIWHIVTGIQAMAVGYRLLALGVVTPVLAGVSALTPTGWRPPPLRWEE